MSCTKEKVCILGQYNIRKQKNNPSGVFDLDIRPPLLLAFAGESFYKGRGI